MRKFIIFVLTVMLIMGGAKFSYASDWDKAGKALTIVEGLRLVTGGRVDLVGGLIGIARGDRTDHRYERPVYRHKPKRQVKRRHYVCEEERVWVPHYTWERRHIPEHEEYDEHLGTVIVKSHYVEYKVEDGGHWDITSRCD